MSAALRQEIERLKQDLMVSGKTKDALEALAASRLGEIHRLRAVVEAAAAIDEVGADAGCRDRLASMARLALTQIGRRHELDTEPPTSDG